MSFVPGVSSVARFSAAKMQKVSLFDSADMFCDLYCLEPGQSQAVHRHADASKFYYVVQGTGLFTVGQRTETLNAGGLAYALPGEVHGVENRSSERLTLLVAMAPNPNRAKSGQPT